jgi:hypothetical protein
MELSNLQIHGVDFTSESGFHTDTKHINTKQQL